MRFEDLYMLDGETDRILVTCALPYVNNVPHLGNMVPIISADVYSLRFVKPLDENYLSELVSSYDEVFVVEEGLVRGGLGEYLQYVLRENRVRCLGIPDRFIAQGARQELLSACGLDPAGIASSVEACMPSGLRFVRLDERQEKG